MRTKWTGFGTSLWMVLLAALLSYSPASVAKNVLVIWGADMQQPWTAEVAAALRTARNSTPGVESLFEESLSFTKLKELPNSQTWVERINSKYAKVDIDLVIAFEHVAANYLHGALPTLLPGSKKIAILGNGELPDLANLGSDNSLEQHVRDVTYLLPNLSEHLLISSLPIVKSAAAELSSTHAELTLASDALSFEQMFKRAESLPKTGAISYAVMLKDARGEIRNPRAVLQELLKRTQVPVFVTYSTLLIPGVVGGHVLDAEKVAQLMIAAMVDSKPSAATEHLGTLKLDAAALQRWSITTDKLPTEAEIYNQQKTLWDTHPNLILGAAAVLLLAMGAVVFMALILRSRQALLRLSELQNETAQKLKREADERLAAELAHTDAEHLAQLALESANIGTFRYNPQTDSMWLSTTASRILDTATDENGLLHSVQEYFQARIVESDFQNIKQGYDPLNKDKVSLTFRIATSDGEIRWVHSISENRVQNAGVVRVGVLRDVTEEQTLTDKLMRAQERMTLALDASHIELFEIEVESGEALPLTQGRGTFQLGQKFDLVQGLTNLSMPRSTREELANVIRQEQRQFEFADTGFDGTKHRWLQLKTGRFYERDGKQYITAVYSDITSIRQHQYLVEQRAKESKLALAASGAGMVRINPHTGQTWMSTRAQEIWDTGPLVGDITSLLKLAEQHHPEDDERVRQQFRQLQSGTAIEHQEYRIRLSSGAYRWIKAAGVMHHDAAGTAQIVAVFFDIDAEKQQLAETEEARDRQTRLFAIIGHELRTPIATLQMMLEEQGVYAMEPFGAQTRDTMQHTLSVLDDLRSVTQPQNSKRSDSPASPYDQLEQTLGSLSALLQERAIRPHFFTNPQAQTLCMLDRQSLRQMVTNLIKNAAIHSGASDIWLTAEAQPLGDERINLSVSISDNGKGIPADQIESLFQPFSRGDTSADGTGLGLHICRDLAQRMGGTLTYERSAQGGAKFVFNSSFKLATDVPSPSQSEEAQIAPLAGKRVLYAEDQKTLQLLTATLLKKQGAEVVVASDGAEALELYQPDQFDFVLTDIMMPNMDGYGLTTALRERGYTGKIVGLTAATIGLETDQLITAGADATLSKPVDIKKFCSLVLAQERV